MSMNNIIRAFAGTMVLISVILTVTVSQNWLYLTAFVGLNLLQSAFTKFCLAEKIFRKIFPTAT